MTISNERVAQLRAETPACEAILHFNSAGASLMPNPVYEAVVEHLTLERDIEGYEASVRARASLDRFYQSFDKTGETPEDLARWLGADHHINISVSYREYAQLDLGRRGLRAVTRASVHYFNTDAEVDDFCKAIAIG